MKGVEYFYDQNGRPKAVLIDLKKNGRLWEDLQDLLVAEQRRQEPRESLEDVKARLQRKRRTNGKR
jgi:hypothetical protein